jgi:hypothetical protein
MNVPIFKENDLRVIPVFAELEQVGLRLSAADKDVLLKGGRTELLRLEAISSAGHRIEKLDAKLSIGLDKNGDADLKYHPIYKEAAYPPGLTDEEAQQLQVGQTASVLKKLKDGADQPREFLFEFDAETREFIRTRMDKIVAPDLVNSERLSDQQKKDYRSGKEVELSDGTKFKFSGIDRNSIRSNRLMLIASLLSDGGLTYILFQGLKSLNGLRNTEPEAQLQSKGFLQAAEEKAGLERSPAPVLEESESMGFTRKGIVR